MIGGGGERKTLRIVAQHADIWNLFGTPETVAHKDAILRRIPSDGTTTGQAWLSGVFTSSCLADRRAEIVDYVNRTFASMPGGARTVQQAIEAMDQCIARRKLMEPEIRSWLAGGGGGRAEAVRLCRALADQHLPRHLHRAAAAPRPAHR